MSTAAYLEGLRRARLALGYSQAEAGALIGKTQSHFGKIERGAVVLTAADAVTLAKAFGVTVDSLLAVTA